MVGFHRSTDSRGFTLIELLIVVAIIGILAAIAVPNFLNAQVRAKLAHTYGQLKTVQTAIGSYAVDNGGWAPIDLGGEVEDGKSYVALTTPVSYLSSIDSCHDIFASRADTSGALYCEYGAALRRGLDPTAPDGQARIQEYRSAGVDYVMCSWGPDRELDWPWTNWTVGLQTIKNPATAGPNRDGGVFFAVSNGLNSKGDIISTNARIFQ